MPMTPEQVRAFFEAHRTVRQYRLAPDGSRLPLPPEHLDLLLYAAQRAPTDATAQLYSLIFLENEKLCARMAELTGNPHFATASASFVLCLDFARLWALLEAAGYEAGEYPHIAHHFGVGDAALAGANLLTAAEMLGYAGCWIGGVMNRLSDVVALLALPKGVLPYAGLTIGRPAESPAQRPRLPRELVVHRNHYREASPSELRAGIKVMNPIAARKGKDGVLKEGDWARLLSAYFGKEGSMTGRDQELREVLRAQELGTQGPIAQGGAQDLPE